MLRIVHCELSKGVSIYEHFAGFFQALDTTGKGLYKIFLSHLKTLGLNLCNCLDQSYDNVSNMQGKNQGVLDLNHKALCVTCGSHTLNLVVGDAAKSSVMSIWAVTAALHYFQLLSSPLNHSQRTCQEFYTEGIVNHQVGV